MIDEFTGDGSDTTFTLSAAPTNENNTQVYVGGVYQEKATYSVSGTTLTLTEAPANGVSIEVMSIAVGQINSAIQLSDADGDTKVMVEESSDEDKIRFDTGGTERAIINSTGLGIGTSSPSAPLTVSTTGSGDAVIIESTEAGSSNAPDLVLHRNSASPADDDSLGIIRFRGENDASEAIDLINVFGQVTDVSDGSEDSTLYFKTYKDGAEQSPLTLVGSNVGIGTTSPSSYYSKELVVAASDNGGITIVNSDTSHAAYLMFADGTSGADAYRGQIGYDHNNNSMFFSTDSTLRLMIDSSGKVFIGLSAQINSSMLSVGDGGVGITYSGAPAYYYRQIYQSSSGNLFFYNGSNQGYIDQAGAFNDASDERIKKDIEDISYGLDTVKALKPRKYKMKLNDDEQIGFIAQEVESLIPEVVDTGETPDGEEQKGMSYGHLTAVLTKAIQEQQELIETLQAKVEALENGTN